MSLALAAGSLDWTTGLIQVKTQKQRMFTVQCSDDHLGDDVGEPVRRGEAVGAVRLAGVDLVLGFDDMAGYTSAPGHGKAAALTLMTLTSLSGDH